MEPPIYLAALERDIAAIGDAVAGHLDVAVPSCPGWSIADLVTHLGRIHRWVLASLESNAEAGPPAFPPRPSGAPDALVEWFATGGRELVAALREGDLDLVHPTWSGPRSGRWWLRRQAMEHAVHRWDAEYAVGATTTPIEVASDGIDEWVEMQSLRGWRPPEDLIGSIHLHGTDGAGEWLIRLDGEMTVTHGHHKGDAAVRGGLSDLYLMVWGRVGAEHVEVLGDADLVDRFLASL